MKTIYFLNFLIFCVGVFTTEFNTPTCVAQTVRSRAVQLPQPTGAHSVGTTVLFLTDKSRKMPIPSGSDHFREMTVQVWYPIEKTDKQRTAAYLTDPLLLSALKKERYLNLESEVLDAWRDLRTHSKLNAPVVRTPARLPLLLFSHGAGMIRANYTTILEELASYGYVVAAIDHPYLGLTVLPGRRVLSFADDDRGPDLAVERVESVARDALFVLDAVLTKRSSAGRFSERIDPNKVGMFGHSLGGAAALEVCRMSNRVKACADLDGSVWGKVETEGVNKPFLVILNQPGEGKRPPEAMRKQRDAEWSGVIEKKKTKAHVVKVAGTFHLSFSDVPFIVPASLLMKNGADIDPRRGHEIMSRVLLDFFSFYLNKKGGRPFDSIDKTYKEMEVKDFN